MLTQQTNLMNFSVSKEILRGFNQYGFDLYIDKNNVIRPVLDYCPVCNSPISDNGYNPVTDERVLAFGLKIYKGRIICSNSDCSFHHSVSEEIISGWLDSLGEVIYHIIKSLGTLKISCGAISSHIRNFLGLPISSEYVRLKLKKFKNNLKIPKRSEEHTSELQSHSFISYAVFCLKKKIFKHIF